MPNIEPVNFFFFGRVPALELRSIWPDSRKKKKSGRWWWLVPQWVLCSAKTPKQNPKNNRNWLNLNWLSNGCKARLIKRGDFNYDRLPRQTHCFLVQFHPKKKKQKNKKKKTKTQTQWLKNGLGWAEAIRVTLSASRVQWSGYPDAVVLKIEPQSDQAGPAISRFESPILLLLLLLFALERHSTVSRRPLPPPSLSEPLRTQRT